MALLRPSTRPRASAELGYRIFAGVVAGGVAELLGVNWARDRDPDCPDYLVPSLVAAAIGVAVAIIDPPDDAALTPPLGDGWLAPDGTFTPAPSGHAEAAERIAGIGPDYEPSDDELRCCNAEFDEVFDDEGNEIEDEEEAERVWRRTWPTGCLAEARLTNTLGYQRVQGRFGFLGYELFSEPTARQVAFLKRLSSGPNLDKVLDVEIGDTCSEEGHGYVTTAPGGLAGPRLRAIDDVADKLAAGDF